MYHPLFHSKPPPGFQICSTPPLFKPPLNLEFFPNPLLIFDLPVIASPVLIHNQLDN